jgi:hypothetical protein
LLDLRGKDTKKNRTIASFLAKNRKTTFSAQTSQPPVLFQNLCIYAAFGTGGLFSKPPVMGPVKPPVSDNKTIGFENVPLLGIKRSHTGNKTFPYWEYFQ